MGFNLQIRFLSFVWTIQFDTSADKQMTQADLAQIAAIVKGKEEEDKEVNYTDTVGFKGETQ